MFNERYGLQSAVFEGKKTQTRREPFFSDVEIETNFDIIEIGKFFVIEKETRKVIHTSRYAVGEIVAVAQSYSDIFDEADNDYFNDIYSNFRNAYVTESKGWKNKMFVRADLMPHHIKILDIRCERLQDISARDCIFEGIKCYYEPKNDWFNMPNKKQSSFSFLDKSKEHFFSSAKEAFCGLIGKLNGKKFWDTNPYVIVYEFEKID